MRARTGESVCLLPATATGQELAELACFQASAGRFDWRVKIADGGSPVLFNSIDHPAIRSLVNEIDQATWDRLFFSTDGVVDEIPSPLGIVTIHRITAGLSKQEFPRLSQGDLAVLFIDPVLGASVILDDFSEIERLTGRPPFWIMTGDETDLLFPGGDIRSLRYGSDPFLPLPSPQADEAASDLF